MATTSNAQILSESDGIIPGKEYEVLNIYTKKGNHLFNKKRLLAIAEKGKTLGQHVTVKSHSGGIVKDIYFKPGDVVKLGTPLILIEACTHPTVLGDICCDCGSMLDSKDSGMDDVPHTPALVSMLHSIPDLKVSQQEAKRLGTEDINNLLTNRKLSLLVDLDQTLIHTTHDDVPPNLKDVYHFQLNDKRRWFHARLRPYTREFLKNISELYELHICTFGIRDYAHHIAHFLDPDKRLFNERILSRNECLDPMSKKGNLSSLFPCGDNMVCIIDDRSDVWNFAPNVVQVLPYHFFQHTGDINAPPGLEKTEDDERAGINFSDIENNKFLDRNSKTEEEASISDSNTKSDGTTKSDTTKEELTEDLKSENVPLKEDTRDDSKYENKSKEDLQKQEMSKEDSQKQEKSTEDSKKQEKSTEDLKKQEKSTEDSKKQEKSTEDSKEEEKSTEDSKEGEELTKDSKREEKSTSKCADDAPSEESKEIDVPDDDDYLLYLEDILKQLHTCFYTNYERNHKENLPDLKTIVPETKKEVLKGVNIVFSGVVPKNSPLNTSKAYHIAVSLGATVSEMIQTSSQPYPTTHLVATNIHTGKAKQALKMKLHVVRPDWLWCCAERWSLVEEKLFELTKSTKDVRSQPPMHCLVPVKSSHIPPEAPPPIKRSPSLMEELNPLVFISNDETKSMQQEVDDDLSDESDEEDTTQSSMRTQSGDSTDGESNISSNGESSSDCDPPPSKRQKLNLDEEDDTQDSDDSDNDDELPSVRFRQGGHLPSDHSDNDSDDTNMDEFGDLLEKMI